ncbi:hypothetical protein K445DRAFT_79619 [Daldinia sp. EC12]|nr:hypothetical protein K445DRAFT_79619 [Daldinia sp. EC12]
MVGTCMNLRAKWKWKGSGMEGHPEKGGYIDPGCYYIPLCLFTYQTYFYVFLPIFDFLVSPYKLRRLSRVGG